MNDWEARWRAQQTGWDQQAPAPALRRELATHPAASPGARALVPGSGSGQDAMALARHGYRCTALDIAPSAAARLEDLLAHATLEGHEPPHTVVGDFFTFTPPHRFDLIWDYTFLCAIPPELRPQWGAQMARLLAPSGRLLTLLFPVDPDNDSPLSPEEPGPPYRLHLSHVRPLLEPVGLVLERYEPVTESHPGREGKEWLAVWRHEHEVAQ